MLGAVSAMPGVATNPERKTATGADALMRAAESPGLIA